MAASRVCCFLGRAVCHPFALLGSCVDVGDVASAHLEFRDSFEALFWDLPSWIKPFPCDVIASLPHKRAESRGLHLHAQWVGPWRTAISIQAALESFVRVYMRFQQGFVSAFMCRERAHRSLQSFCMWIVLEAVVARSWSCLAVLLLEAVIE